MEDADEEWNRIEYSGEGEVMNVGGKARWVLNRGLRLGKQILVAGFLASSAPVLLPPLVVVSVIGISVSMPYGLFLASHACTHKLMTKLLPMPTPDVLEAQQKQDRKLEEETTRGIEMADVKDINMALRSEKDEPPLSQHTIIRGEEKASPQVEILITIEGLDKTDNDIEEFEVTNVVALEEFGSEDEEKELEKETKGLLEKIRDEAELGVANASDQRIGPIVEGDEKVEDPKVGEHIKDVDDRNGIDSQAPISSAPKMQDYSILAEKADASEVVDESGFDLFEETSIDPEDNTYRTDSHGESSKAMVDEHAEPMEPAFLYVHHKSTQSEYSSAKDITSPCPSNEVLLNEEKIWKEINAIRLIVGYEGTPQASCVDELKNLYIFTGVEPPTYLNHSCNPLEINEKLHFLMSILGVKPSVP